MAECKEKEEKKYNVGFSQEELEEVKEFVKENNSALRCLCDK